MYVFIIEMYYKKSQKDLLFEYSANLNLTLLLSLCRL